MIEVIYKEDKEDQGTVQEPFSMPRNVRQIGLANGDYRIYIEDYVYTFLCSLAEDGETESQGNVAVLPVKSNGRQITHHAYFSFFQDMIEGKKNRGSPWLFTLMPEKTVHPARLLIF